MKNYKKYMGCLSLFALTLIGCEDLKFGEKFLDKPISNEQNIDSVFNKKVYAEQALAETYHSLPDYLPSISGFSDNYPQLLLYYLHPWRDLRLLLKAGIHFLSYLQKWMPEFPAYRHR